MVRVGVVGYGTIGRRVADAVARQSDMELVGIVKTRPDYKGASALARGYRLYALDEKSRQAFREKGVPVSGLFEDLVKASDIVVDASPAGSGMKNRPLYEKLEKKAIFEGGEKAEVGEVSFVAQCNYEMARGKKFVRVVSCNTTGISRLVHSLDKAFGLERAHVIIARKATDPDDPLKGPVDSVNIESAHIPSHHGEDVAEVMPGLDVVSMAFVVPTTRMHFHTVIASLRDKSVREEEVIHSLEEAPRIRLVDVGDGIMSTAHVMDMAREMGRERSDLHELVVWKHPMAVRKGEVLLHMAVHMESIVIPENVDAIRAMTGTHSKEESMKITNETLGIHK